MGKFKSSIKKVIKEAGLYMMGLIGYMIYFAYHGNNERVGNLAITTILLFVIFLIYEMYFRKDQ